MPEGKKVSDLVREEIEGKFNHLDQQGFAEQMKAAYQDLAEENIRICEDFRFSDTEKACLKERSMLNKYKDL